LPRGCAPRCNVATSCRVPWRQLVQWEYSGQPGERVLGLRTERSSCAAVGYLCALAAGRLVCALAAGRLERFVFRCAGFQQLLQFPALRSPSRSPTMRTRPSPVGSHGRSSPKRRSNVYANFSFGSHSERCSPGVHKTGLLFRVIPSLCSSGPRPRPRLTQRRHPHRMQCRRRWRTTRVTLRTCSATLPI
jgi:hypothetical protein